MDRADAIRNSLASFVAGLISLLPLIGLLPALYSLICWSRVYRKYHDWNPASGYLDWGLRLSVTGLALSALAAMAIVVSQ